MERSRIDMLALLAGGLTIMVALIHLNHPSAGFPRLLELLRTDNLLLDPRPPLFSLLGVAMIGGVLLVWNGMLPRRRAYEAGMAVMVLFLIGYAVWHLTGHGGVWPWRAAHTHHTPPLESLWNHYRSEPWAQVSKTLEMLAVGLLGYVYLVDVR